MKTTIDNITKAVLIFEDPNTGMVRKVMFGEPKELLPMFTFAAQVAVNRMMELIDVDAKDAKTMEQAVHDTMPIFETDNVKKHAFGKPMTLTYEVK